jgi:hypothetical protein
MVGSSAPGQRGRAGQKSRAIFAVALVDELFEQMRLFLSVPGPPLHVPEADQTV